MKLTIKAKLNIEEQGGSVSVKRTQPTSWQELGLYLECVAFLASRALEEGNPKDIKNLGEMDKYISDYMRKAIPDFIVKE